MECYFAVPSQNIERLQRSFASSLFGSQGKKIAMHLNSQHKDYGECIGSLLILEHKKPLEAFQEFLTSRKSCILQLLSMDTTTDNVKWIQDQLCQVLVIMQLTLLHTYTLFFSSDTQGVTPLGSHVAAKPMLNDLLRWTMTSLCLDVETQAKNDIATDLDIIAPSGACADTIRSAFEEMQSYNATYGKITKDLLTKWIHECSTLVNQNSATIFGAITKALHLSQIQNAVYHQCQTLTNSQFDIANNNIPDQTTNIESESVSTVTSRVDWSKVC